MWLCALSVQPAAAAERTKRVRSCGSSSVLGPLPADDSSRGWSRLWLSDINPGGVASGLTGGQEEFALTVEWRDDERRTRPSIIIVNIQECQATFLKRNAAQLTDRAEASGHGRRGYGTPRIIFGV